MAEPVLVVWRIPIGPRSVVDRRVFAHQRRNGGRLYNLERHTYLAHYSDAGQWSALVS